MTIRLPIITLFCNLMKFRTLLSGLLTGMLVLSGVAAYCAPDSTISKNSKQRYCSAVLVEVKSEHNRIQYCDEHNLPKTRERIISENAKITKAMTSDFNDNFKYAPVYFYIDTNRELIKQKKFAGILLDSNLNPVQSAVITPANDDYFIAFYGYPLPLSRLHDKVPASSDKNSVTSGDVFGKGLIITNDKFEQLTYFYKLGWDELFFKFKKDEAKKYVFISKKYDMEYYPFAKTFNVKLNGRMVRSDFFENLLMYRLNQTGTPVNIWKHLFL